MTFLQALMLLLILSANGIIIPNSVWYCLIAWLIVLFFQSLLDVLRKKKNKKPLDNQN